MTTNQLLTLQKSITQGEWIGHCPVPELNTAAAVSSVHGMHVCDVSSYGAAIETRNSNATAISLVPSLLAEVIRLRNALLPLASDPFNCDDDKAADERVTLTFSMAEIRAARAALANE